MKNILKILVLFLIITSCEDGEKDPVITGNIAPFVKYQSNSSSLDLSDSSSSVSGTFFSERPNLIESHEITVALINEDDTPVYHSLETISSFPYEFSSTIEELATAVGTTVGGLNPGDRFRFECITTGINGEVISRIETLDNADGETGSSAQQQGYNFEGVVVCPFNIDELDSGTYNVIQLGFAGFFGETSTTRTVQVDASNLTVTIVEGEFPVEGSDPLILTLDTDGNVVSVNTDGQSFGSGPTSATNGFPINNYLLESGVIFSCIDYINLTLNFSPFNGNPHPFILQKQ